MSAFVVDVNVPIVANEHTPHADLNCVSVCVDTLAMIVRDGAIVLDDGMRILKLYLNYLSPNGQPGVGDAFMQWVWENQAVSERCELVTLTPNGHGTTDFQQFPDDPSLTGFDQSDRVYVAVALASTRNPEVLNAVDTDWWQHRAALLRCGIRLRFLCPQHMTTPV